MNPADTDTELPESARPPAAPAAAAVPPLPMIWIGYLLGVATIIAEFVAVSLDPELAKQGGIPPLYLFLVSFVGGVYWFVCIYRYHVILAIVTGRKYPISAGARGGISLHPVLQLLLGLQMAERDRELREFPLGRENDAADSGRCRGTRRACAAGVRSRFRPAPALFPTFLCFGMFAPRARRTDISATCAASRRYRCHCIVSLTICC